MNGILMVVIPPETYTIRNPSISMAQVKPKDLVTLIISLLIAGASAWLALGSRGVYCDRLPPMTVCATLAAFAIALCFRQMDKTRGRMLKWLLGVALLIAGVTLFADARFVLKYRGLCSQLQEQIRQMHEPSH